MLIFTIVMPRVLYGIIISLLLMSQVDLCFSQNSYGLNVIKSKEICLKARATLQISGTDGTEEIYILWSNGEKDKKSIEELTEGDYHVRIRIKHEAGGVTYDKDTVLFFNIEKELCGVTVDKYFSPNEDNYHDVLGVTNAQFYPNFEFHIFNKWGQQVHKQKQTYTPWDGKWNGVDMPDGAYYYVFFYNADDKSKLVKGDITILR